MKGLPNKTRLTCAGNHFNCVEEGLAMLKVHHFSLQFILHHVNQGQFRNMSLKNSFIFIAFQAHSLETTKHREEHHSRSMLRKYVNILFLLSNSVLSNIFYTTGPIRNKYKDTGRNNQVIDDLVLNLQYSNMMQHLRINY